MTTREHAAPSSAAGGTPGAEARLTLPDGEDAVTIGRRFVAAQARAAGATELADDAAACASELLANAVQHGRPPVVVGVRATPTGVTLAVHDAGPRGLVRPVASQGNMTGRGLLLVEQLSVQWGVHREPNCKTVWCTLAVDPAAAQSVGITDPLTAWVDEPDGLSGETYFTVALGDIPTDLLVAAKAHIDNLVREFSLAASGKIADGVTVPEDLARLIATVVHGFADARMSIKQQASAAAHRGEPRTSVTLTLPLSAADAGEAYLAALDQADRYARAARLLTLEAPPDHKLFRRWYVNTVIDQLRRAADGEPAVPVVPFDQVLLTEVRRLSQVEGPPDTREC